MKKKELSLAWEKVVSPYVLKDQSLNSVIRVKAVDRAGNERIVEFDNRGLEALKSAKVISFRSLTIAILALFSVVFIAVLTVIFRRRRR